ncbi:MAG: peptidyl-prolyl cis-trans isomerase [Candidatus Zipacnadales bacterium]
MIRCVIVGDAVLLLLCFTLPIAMSQEPLPIPPPSPPLLATVGSDAITGADWVASLKAFHGAQALRFLIEERLVIQEAHRLGITISGSDIEAQIARLKTQYPNERAFEKMLHERGISLNALRREIKKDLLLDRIVDKLAKISDEDVKAYYEAHITEYLKPARRDVYAITAGDIRTAAEAYERLAHEEFATVAEELSIDKHAAEGGHWGWVSAADLEPEELRTKIFNLELNKLTEPVEIGEKVYVLKVIGEQPGSQITLIEATPAIREKLRTQRGINRNSVMRGIIGRASITINQPEYAYLMDEYERARQTQVMVDGRLLELDTPPFVVAQTQRMVVPAEPVLEAMGAEVRWWPPPNQTLQIIRGNKELRLVVGGTEAHVLTDGKLEITAVDQPPVLDKNGVVFVAPRWVVEQLGGSLDWSAAEGILKIKSVKEEPAGQSEPGIRPTSG